MGNITTSPFLSEGNEVEKRIIRDGTGKQIGRAADDGRSTDDFQTNCIYQASNDCMDDRASADDGGIMQTLRKSQIHQVQTGGVNVVDDNGDTLD